MRQYLAGECNSLTRLFITDVLESAWGQIDGCEAHKFTLKVTTFLSTICWSVPYLLPELVWP